MGMNHLAFCILCEILGMSLCPRILLRHMVGHPVEPHLHAQFMGTGNECLQVFNSAIFWVHSLVVHHSVRTVHRGAPWIDRHQPDDIDTKRVEPVQLSHSSQERTFWREGSHVHLVDDAVLVADRLCTIDLKASGSPATGCYEQHCGKEPN